MLIGTRWTFSSRFCAVTTSSCTVEPEAWAAAEAGPSSTAEAAISAALLDAQIHAARDPVLVIEGPRSCCCWPITDRRTSACQAPVEAADGEDFALRAPKAAGASG